MAARFYFTQSTNGLFRRYFLLTLAFALAACATIWIYIYPLSTAQKRLEIGDPCGAFMVQKIAGAEEDGVNIGDNLCYRCKYQARPIVLLFSRRTDAHIGALTRSIDQSLANHQDQQLRAIFALLGNDLQELSEAGTAFCRNHDLQRIPIVIPEDKVTGPSNYKLSPRVDLSVILIKAGRVFATFEFASNNIDTDNVLECLERMLSEAT